MLKDVEAGSKILKVGYLTLYLERSHILSSFGFQPVYSGCEVTGHWSKTILSLLGYHPYLMIYHLPADDITKSYATLTSILLLLISGTQNKMNEFYVVNHCLYSRVCPWSEALGEYHVN